VTEGVKQLTAEQLAALERRDGELLLAAAAGSGKTSVLVERFARLVCDDGIEVGRVLAITFTEKAASELKGRVRGALLARGEEARAREAEAGWISTIHGFCARILRTHALSAGLDPRFVVLDGPEADRVARDAFFEALDEHVAARGEPAEAMVGAYGADPLRGAITNAHDELRSRGRPPELPPLGPRTTPGEAAERLGAAAEALGRELGALPDPGVSVRNALAALDACRGRLDCFDEAEIPRPGEWDDAAVKGGGGNALGTDATDAYRGAHREFVKACVDHHAAQTYELMGDLLDRFATHYAQRKAERSAQDFSDLELAAHGLLTRDLEVRARVSERFERIMVDEFQDTNQLQLDLLRLIARDNLFTVGDEMQAIYGFRHADVQLFRDRRTELEPVGRVRALRRNFRSHPSLLAALNAAFEPALGERFVPLVAPEGAAPGAPDGEPRVEVLVTDCEAPWGDVELVASGTPPPAQPWRAAEARLLAQRIDDLLAAGRRAGDIVVLLRATGDMALYERALEDRGVRTYLIGGRGYWAHREVQDGLAHLSVLANPRDELRLYEVLASPLVGVSSDAIVLLNAAARAAGSDAWSVLTGGVVPPGVPAQDAEKLASWVAWMSAERRNASRRSLEDLIDRALERSGYDLAVLGAPGGRRRLANVRKLMRLARLWEAANGRDLRGFLESAKARAGEELELSRESEAPVEGEDLDAVRLMTIHRAKGLEFPVVCVADLGRQQPAGGQELLRLGRDDRVGLKLATLGGASREKALDWNEVGAAADRRAAEEERRLFYVAATRAQEKLILSGAARGRDWTNVTRVSPPLSWLGPAFVADLAELTLAEEGEPQGVRAHPDDPAVRVGFMINRPEHVGRVLREESLAPSPTADDEDEGSPHAEALATPAAATPPPLALGTLSYTTLQRYERCGYRFYLEDGLRLPRGEEAFAASSVNGDGDGGGIAANVRGSIAHTLLENHRFSEQAPPGPELIDAAAAEHGAVLTAEEREDLSELVERFLDSDLAARLAGVGAAIRREERFAFGLDELVVVGAFDALVRENGRALVVDYKTNRLGGRLPADIVSADYAVQRLVYALALLRDGADEVEVAFSFLEAPGHPVIERYPAGEAPALERRLREVASGLLDQRFTVAAEPGPELCHGCPGRGTLCSWPREATEQPAHVLSTAAHPVLPGFEELR
jgi:ATP-dependent exoDNAse (exonuclease V) beta subunit